MLAKNCNKMELLLQFLGSILALPASYVELILLLTAIIGFVLGLNIDDLFLDILLGGSVF